jgi:hypothetical protein
MERIRHDLIYEFICSALVCLKNGEEPYTEADILRKAPIVLQALQHGRPELFRQEDILPLKEEEKKRWIKTPEMMNALKSHIRKHYVESDTPGLTFRKFVTHFANTTGYNCDELCNVDGYLPVCKEIGLVLLMEKKGKSAIYRVMLRERTDSDVEEADPIPSPIPSPTKEVYNVPASCKGDIKLKRQDADWLRVPEAVSAFRIFVKKGFVPTQKTALFSDILIKFNKETGVRCGTLWDAGYKQLCKDTGLEASINGCHKHVVKRIVKS